MQCVRQLWWQNLSIDLVDALPTIMGNSFFFLWWQVQWDMPDGAEASEHYQADGPAGPFQDPDDGHAAR